MSKKIIKNDLVTWSDKVLDFSHKYDWYEDLGAHEKLPELMLVLDVKKTPASEAHAEVIVYKEQVVATYYEDELVKVNSGSV